MCNLSDKEDDCLVVTIEQLFSTHTVKTEE
jgi:hypothetical protein